MKYITFENINQAKLTDTEKHKWMEYFNKYGNKINENNVNFIDIMKNVGIGSAIWALHIMSSDYTKDIRILSYMLVKCFIITIFKNKYIKQNVSLSDINIDVVVLYNNMVALIKKVKLYCDEKIETDDLAVTYVDFLEILYIYKNTVYEPYLTAVALTAMPNAQFTHNVVYDVFNIMMRNNENNNETRALIMDIFERWINTTFKKNISSVKSNNNSVVSNVSPNSNNKNKDKFDVVSKVYNNKIRPINS